MSAVTREPHNNLTRFTNHGGNRVINSISRFTSMRRKNNRVTRPFAKPIRGPHFVLTVPSMHHVVNIESDGLVNMWLVNKWLLRKICSVSWAGRMTRFVSITISGYHTRLCLSLGKQNDLNWLWICETLSSSALLLKLQTMKLWKRLLDAFLSLAD